MFYREGWRFLIVFFSIPALLLILNYIHFLMMAVDSVVYAESNCPEWNQANPQHFTIVTSVRSWWSSQEKCHIPALHSFKDCRTIHVTSISSPCYLGLRHIYWCRNGYSCWPVLLTPWHCCIQHYLHSIVFWLLNDRVFKWISLEETRL